VAEGRGVLGEAGFFGEGAHNDKVFLCHPERRAKDLLFRSWLLAN